MFESLSGLPNVTKIAVVLDRTWAIPDKPGPDPYEIEEPISDWEEEDYELLHDDWETWRLRCIPPPIHFEPIEGKFANAGNKRICLDRLHFDLQVNLNSRLGDGYDRRINYESWPDPTWLIDIDFVRMAPLSEDAHQSWGIDLEYLAGTVGRRRLQQIKDGTLVEDEDEEE